MSGVRDTHHVSCMGPTLMVLPLRERASRDQCGVISRPQFSPASLFRATRLEISSGLFLGASSVKSTEGTKFVERYQERSRDCFPNLFTGFNALAREKGATSFKSLTVQAENFLNTRQMFLGRLPIRLNREACNSSRLQCICSLLDPITTWRFAIAAPLECLSGVWGFKWDQ